MYGDAQVALRNYCVKHREEIDLYCRSCKTPTCTECLKTDHNGHDVDTVRKFSRKIKARSLDLHAELEMKINRTRSKNQRHLRNVKSRNNVLLQRNLDSAEKKRAELHQTVDELIKSQVNAIKSHSKKLEEEIWKEEEMLHQDDSELDEKMENFTTSKLTGLDLILYHKELNTKVATQRILDLHDQTIRQVFEEGEVDRESIQKMIGQTKNVNESSSEVKTIASFQEEDRLAYTICPVSQTEAWVTYKCGEEFTLLRRDGRHINSINKDENLKLNSFILQNDAFLSCATDDRVILKTDISGKWCTWKCTAPLHARFIGEGLYGNVLLSRVGELEEEDDEAPGTQANPITRMVQMLTPSGDVLCTYGNEKGTTSVLTRPGYVAQNYNSDVCVVNWFKVAKDKARGNICVFFEDGQLKFVYKGNGGELIPRGICYDLLCNILCANYFDSTIHVVSNEGAFLRYLLTRDTCVPNPYTLALHRGVLWLGSKEGKVNTYRYIH